MASETTDPALETSIDELLDTLRSIEEAVDRPSPSRFIRPPTPRGLVEFTSEVGIPAAILVLRTNIAALELLQRTLRMMDDRSGRDRSGSDVADRAATLTTASLGRLDDALRDLQSAMDGRSTDRSPDDLLAEARRRTEDLEARLADLESGDRENWFGPRRSTGIDVDAELESLRENVDRGSDDEDRDDESP